MTPQRNASSDKGDKSRQASLFAEENSWRGKLSRFLQGFSRYGWDLLGIFLLSLGMILLLGFFNITSGVLVESISRSLAITFGLGRYLLVVVLIAIALQVIRWRKHPPVDISLSKILAYEFSFFFLLGLFSLIGGGTANEARAGNDPGGIVGWGLAELFRKPFGPTAGFLLITGCFLISVIVAFNVFSRIENLVRDHLSGIKSQKNVKEVGDVRSGAAIITENEEQGDIEEEQPKKPVWLPPEFRKSFNSPSLSDEKPENPQERSPDMPPMTLLQEGDTIKPDTRSINMSAGLIEKTLDEFGIPAKVVGFRSGPTVTQFAVEPGYIDKADDERQKIRVSQISSLQRDLALALSAERLRIEAPVPGKSYVGIEIPNTKSSDVRLRPLLESEAFYRVNSPLALALGRDVSGRPVVTDLTTMPHLLIAGTTGSGKSVCITALTTCLVMNNTPEDLKLAMIDPKRVELMRFNGLPHLMGNVETEIERILGVLRWATTEMDFRYKLLEKAHARNVDSYNKKMERLNKPRLPKIVILIDELADLMISAPDQTEHAIIRLAQKARAIGIHLILATQRPSTDVVTGLIKANFPTRISFTVATSIDSRVILDTSGAETLLGKGDMLFLHPEIGLPLRAQGVIVSDKELDKVIRWWKKQEKEKNQPEQSRYDDTDEPPWEERIGVDEAEDEDDALIDEAIALIKSEGHASASYFQRQLRVGYPRAARLIDQLEDLGIIGPSQGGGREREILIELDEDDI